MAVRVRKPPPLGKRVIRDRLVAGRLEKDRRSLGGVEDWTLDMISHELQVVAAEEVDQQERLDNEAIRVLVDKKPSRQLGEVEKRIDVWFGVDGVRTVKRLVENAVKSEIDRLTVRRTGSLYSDWRWRRLTDGDRIARGDSDNLTFGESLIYTPVGRNRQYVALANSAVARRGGTRPQGPSVQGESTGGRGRGAWVPMIIVRMSTGTESRRARSKGFMAKAVNKARRAPQASGFWIKVVFGGRGRG